MDSLLRPHHTAAKAGVADGKMIAPLGNCASSQASGRELGSTENVER